MFTIIYTDNKAVIATGETCKELISNFIDALNSDIVDTDNRTIEFITQ